MHSNGPAYLSVTFSWVFLVWTYLILHRLRNAVLPALSLVRWPPSRKIPVVDMFKCLTPNIYRKNLSKKMSKTKTYQNGRNLTTGFGFGRFLIRWKTASRTRIILEVSIVTIGSGTSLSRGARAWMGSMLSWGSGCVVRRLLNEAWSS